MTFRGDIIAAISGGKKYDLTGIKCYEWGLWNPYCVCYGSFKKEIARFLIGPDSMFEHKFNNVIILSNGMLLSSDRLLIINSHLLDIHQTNLYHYILSREEYLHDGKTKVDITGLFKSVEQYKIDDKKLTFNRIVQEVYKYEDIYIGRIGDYHYKHENFVEIFLVDPNQPKHTMW
jgi:hypothetical protein